MAVNGNGFRIAFWVLTVIATVGLAGAVDAIVKNDRLRASEDKEIVAEYKKDDGILRVDFLLALNNMRLEQKADMEKLTDKVDKISNEVSAIKVKVEGK